MSDARASELRVSRLEADELELSAIAKLARCGPGTRWEDELGAARDEALRLAAPRARVLPLTPAEVSAVFESETPVRDIAGAGECTLFAVTLGAGLEQQVKAYFDDAYFLEGVLLDAAASVAVEALCDRVERTIADGRSSSRFSPGYCSWSVASQQRLFEVLHPDEIGVELGPSMLMSPLKSVTGMIVVADPDKLYVPAHECSSCEARGCTRRRSAR